jgi:hypothetical protein
LASNVPVLPALSISQRSHSEAEARRSFISRGVEDYLTPERAQRIWGGSVDVSNAEKRLQIASRCTKTKQRSILLGKFRTLHELNDYLGPTEEYLMPKRGEPLVKTGKTSPALIDGFEFVNKPDDIEVGHASAETIQVREENQIEDESSLSIKKITDEIKRESERSNNGFSKEKVEDTMIKDIEKPEVQAQVEDQMFQAGCAPEVIRQFIAKQTKMASDAQPLQARHLEAHSA